MQMYWFLIFRLDTSSNSGARTIDITRNLLVMQRLGPILELLSQNLLLVRSQLTFCGHYSFTCIKLETSSWALIS